MIEMNREENNVNVFLPYNKTELSNISKKLYLVKKLNLYLIKL